MKWVKTMPKAKKEETLDLETPIEEVVETPAEEKTEETRAKEPKVEEVKVEKSKSTENKVVKVKPTVAKTILHTELFAVQHKRTTD